MTQVQLIHGDCLEEMAKLEAGSIDLIFTSPPYNLGENQGGHGKPSSKWKNATLAAGYTDHADLMPYPEYVEWQKECLTAMWRLLSPTGAIFYNHKPRVQNCIARLPTDLNPDLPIRQIIIWKRAGGINSTVSQFMPTHEWIIIFAKPDFRLKNQGVSGFGDVWEITQENGKNSHPAPFPVALPERAIVATKAQVILDPFVGSGSTAIAAINQNRASFIGIEKSAKYLEMARQRIGLVQAQGRFMEMVG